MKIVVVYATAGAGHKKAALSIAEHISGAATGDTVACADIVDRSSLFFRLIYFRGYDFLINHCQWLWSLFFGLTSRQAFRPMISRLATWIHYYNTRRFSRFLIGAKPDVVVSTHFLSSDIVSFLKSRNMLRARLITVVTDFGIHPFWVCAHTDRYCVASAATKEILARQGVAADIISVTGIPTDPKFSRPHDRREICGRLKIDPGKKTVLIVTGSFGIGPIEGLVKALHRDYTVLAVCARNKSLYRRLVDKAYGQTLVFGFIDHIDELMAVADVIITKPGGLTISELLCMDCIPLFIAAIPGQESVNVSVLQGAGIGCTVRRVSDIHRQVTQCIRDAQQIKGAIRAFRQSNAVARIYDALRTDSTGTAC